MNRCRGAVGAGLIVASGLMLAMAGAATATADAASPIAEIGTGSANALLGLLATGSSEPGSSVSGGVSFGAGDVAATPPSTGSSETGSTALCTTDPTTAGCPE